MSALASDVTELLDRGLSIEEVSIALCVHESAVRDVLSRGWAPGLRRVVRDVFQEANRRREP